MKNNMTLGSLFDGSGGFALGGILCGIRSIWASEIEPFPIRVTTCFHLFQSLKLYAHTYDILSNIQVLLKVDLPDLILVLIIFYAF